VISISEHQKHVDFYKLTKDI